MEAEFFQAEGEGVNLDQLEIKKAHGLASMLDEGKIQYASFIECRKMGDSETVIFQVNVEVPQLKKHPIQPFERIAVTFRKADSTHPIVHALRKDFPQVPHLNLRNKGSPQNLCINEDRYKEIKHRWTPPLFIHRIRNWLKQTALGTLHQNDQPLEPLLLGYHGHLILPPLDDLLTNDPQPLFVPTLEGEEGFRIAQRQPPQGKALKYIVSIHQCPPQTHGAIYYRPATLAKLADLASRAELDILPEVKKRLQHWITNDKTILDSRILLVIIFPRKRSYDREAEAWEIFAFSLKCTVHGLSQKMGLNTSPKKNSLHTTSTGSTYAETINLDVLNVSFQLTRSMATFFNNSKQANDTRITAIGAGALGSQILMNLARHGFGKWTIIDHDTLMPHNVARHALTSDFVGYNKAKAIAAAANSITYDTNPFTALAKNVLTPIEQNPEVKKAFQNTDVILDMSASIAVAREITHEIKSSARRVSLFLTPSGHSLVLLAENKDRTIPLDSIEMQYYRAVANKKKLVKHFKVKDNKKRYGQSCRDITSLLPQDLVALHAATGTKAIQKALSRYHATVAIWRTEGSGSVKRIDIELFPVIYHKIQNWTIVTDEGLLQKLEMFRKEKLPNETGGVLLGSFDLDRNVIYITDALRAPPDSKEHPILYIRGCQELSKEVDKIHKRTYEMLEYIGEWHSHPEGARVAASCDDHKVFSWLTEIMDSDGLPGVMMIVGDSGKISCYAGEIMGEENLLPRVHSHE